MKSRKNWNLAALAKHEGQWLLLGDGSVAVTYTLLGSGRVRVSFYVADQGHFQHCVTDTGDARKLIQILCKQVIRTRSQLSAMRLQAPLEPPETNGTSIIASQCVRRVV